MSHRACFCRRPVPNVWRGLRQWGSLCRASVGVKERGAKSVVAGEDSAAFEDGQVQELVVVFEGVCFVAGEDFVGRSFWFGDEGEAEGARCGESGGDRDDCGDACDGSGPVGGDIGFFDGAGCVRGWRRTLGVPPFDRLRMAAAAGRMAALPGWMAAARRTRVAHGGWDRGIRRVLGPPPRR